MDDLAFSIFTHIAAGVIAVSIYRRAVRKPQPWQDVDIAGGCTRCRFRSPDDVDGLQDVARRIGA